MSRPWLVTDARKVQLSSHPKLQFKFKRLQSNLSSVTHVKSDATGWIDTASAIGSMFFPELAPLIMPASQIVKRLMRDEPKSERKEIMREAVQAKRSVRKAELIASMRDVPSVARAPDQVRVQSNLVEALSQNSRPMQDASQPVRFASLPRSNSLSPGDVPVLHGQTGNMPLLPVTIQRTENHATMSGTEFLGTLQLDTAQTGVGLMIQSFELNPRLFPGTKLTAEALTWSKFRFRKFVVEYIPIQGSNTTGSFTGYFTPDPSEPDIGGVQAVRNAIEHPHALMFQPFFHSIMAYSEDTIDDKMVYFCRIDPEGDPRLALQAVFKIVQNVSNTTGVAFGQFLVHYEIDYYWPETVAVQPTPTWPTAMNAAVTNTVDTVIVFTPTSNLPTTQLGTIYKAILTGGNATVTNYHFSGGTNSPAIGQTVWFRQAENIPGSVCSMYDTLSDAYDGGPEGQLRNKSPVAVITNWTIRIIQQISPDSFSAEEGLALGLKTQPDETPDLSSADFLVTPSISTSLPIHTHQLPALTEDSKTRALRSMLERMKLK